MYRTELEFRSAGERAGAALLRERSPARVTDPPFRPIAHLGQPGSRAGLCGAEILGIPAFGTFDPPAAI